MSDKKATLNVDGLDEAIELPIYSGSIGRWRNYAEHLGELRDALGPYAPAE